MKKTLYILLALLLGLVSCTVMPFEGPEPIKAEETGLVSVIMQLQVPVPLDATFTKASNRDSIPQIDYIKVAVFGTSEYPQAYTLAEPVNSDGSPRSSYATTNGDTYYFKVLLPVYEGKASIHIIANGDESIKFVDETETSIMESMRTQKDTAAYWAHFVMEDGILPQKDVNGIMQTDIEGNFIPSDETKAYFQHLTLVRNFAEVILTNESENLTDISWALVNVPTMGSVAPMAAGTYVDDYADYTYNGTTGRMVNGSKVYEGFMFEEDSLDYSYPEASDFKPLEKPNFLYERRHPGSDKATCLLVKAKFINDSGVQDSDYTYYRIDLMNEDVGGYFPIYRNYKYQIKIHKVGNSGATSIAEAMNRDSGGNVSMSTEALSLTDISDGASRLMVEYVEKNFTSGGKKGLWVQYIPNASTGTVNNSSVKVTIKDKGNALKSGSNNDELTPTASSTVDGYYFYEFELKDQDENEDLLSTLQVMADNGKTDDDKSTLYRDVKLRVMKKMDMDLDLVPKQVSGTDTTILKISLPDSLPSSMFPLEIYIEDINHTLNPTQQDGYGHDITLPVKTAKSLADSVTNSFYFIRTVNESEYKDNHTISTEFQTIQGTSATTIYVANEYFKTQHINLLNNGIYVNPTKATVAFNVTSVEIEVESADAASTWTVTAGTGVTVNVSGTQTGTGKFTMSFAQNNSQSDISRTARVTSNGVNHDITITQRALEFSLDPPTQTVAYDATTATVMVYADDGATWTATVNNGASLEGAVDGILTGEGTASVKVLFLENEGDQKTYTVSATCSGLTRTSDIIQRSAYALNEVFNVNSFTYGNFGNNNNRTGTATSNDGYVSVNLAYIGNSSGNNVITNGYIQMGRNRTGGNRQRGSITVTPNQGTLITQIKITYTTETYRGYDFGNTQSVTVTPGIYNRDTDNVLTATWTGSSTGTVTFTNGYSSDSNGGLYPRITSIEVTYEPAN